MKNKKGYWLFFEPYVHIALKKSLVLLYNTINGERIKVIEPDLIKLIYATQHYLNQGVVFLEDKLYKQKIVNQFIYEIREKFIGDIIEISLLPEKPIQFIPIPGLKKGTVKQKSSLDELAHEDLFSYFHFLTIQINNSCNLSCFDCSYSYKQNFNCFYNKKIGKLEMPFSEIEKIYEKIATVPLKRMYLTGGNIFLHSKFKEIIELFNDSKINCSIGFHYFNLPNDTILEKLKNYKFEIFVNPPYQTDKIIDTICLLKERNNEHLFRFRMKSEQDYDFFEIHFKSILGKDTFTIEPLYTGKNLDFFEKNVFMSEDDIFEEPISQHTVFANSILNSNLFGHIHIDCTGNVKSNPNSKQLLGNIFTDTFHRVISNELLNNYSWKNTRKKSPCKQCIYQFLCPPPSNYEFVLKRNNLCHV